jgi:hypothetical protein
MGNRLGFGWLIGLLAVAALAAVGVYTYNLGVAHGLTEAARMSTPATGVPVVAWWPRPWGFGFFPFFPLLFILFWIVLLRGFFWRARWHGACGCTGVPPAFDEWHRRAHGADPVTSGSEAKA